MVGMRTQKVRVIIKNHSKHIYTHEYRSRSSKIAISIFFYYFTYKFEY